MGLELGLGQMAQVLCWRKCLFPLMAGILHGMSAASRVWKGNLQPPQSGLLGSLVCWKAGASGARELCPPMFGCSEWEECLVARYGSVGCPCDMQYLSIPTIPLARGLGKPGHNMTQEAWGASLPGRALLHPGCHGSSFPLPHKESGSR